MIAIQAGQFGAFFEALHGNRPFPWQQRLADQVCAGSWPPTIDLPTASGKTACIDIAIFSLALLGNDAPRRIFFIVDRRVILQEAFERARRIRCKLAGALADPGAPPILIAVAQNLRELAGDAEANPLECYELRGGAYRDESWVETPLQPAVIASTVDQIGSRLLFRGYGVSDKNLPIYAGMIANDSIIFLDEAHCSKPFGQTVRAIARYLKPEWAASPLEMPFRFVEMTATPSGEDGAQPFTITDDDHQNQVLNKRLRASKPALLKEVKGRKNDFDKLADELANEAIRLAQETAATRAAIMVNRVNTAKLVRDKLKESGHDALLVIGRMRPYDRDQLVEKYKPFKTGEPRTPEPTRFVVSTQCLEVGADLDFDVLVTECASIDALVQRFGRLDRIGAFGRARGSILIGTWQQDAQNPDAVYGAALADTWAWLKTLESQGPIDFAIENDSGSTVAQRLQRLDCKDRDKLRLETADAPILLPAHLDTLVQTNPRPEPEPAIELFLHGPDNRVTDVQVVWREDLGDDPSHWAGIVSLCKPSSREAMPVALGAFMKWLGGEKRDTEQSDIDGRQGDSEQTQSGPEKRGLIWRNGKPETRSLRSVRPGEMVILPAVAGGWDFFGQIPENAPIDVADRTRFDMKREITLRIHPQLLEKNDAADRLRDKLRGETYSVADLLDFRDAFRPHAQPILDAIPAVRRPEIDEYPDKSGWVFHGWLSRNRHEPKQVTLERHLSDVANEAGINTRRLPAFAQAVQHSAKLHDYGKADIRFQTYLRAGDEMAARFSPTALAKSGKSWLPKQSNFLPKDFRHELLSLLFAQKSHDINGPDRELILHLIASHHGFCRPFAPVVIDTNPECLEYNGIKICAHERLSFAPHRLGSGVSDRFWSLTRQYGWWGLAYLEALLRLADWKASDEEYAEVEE